MLAHQSEMTLILTLFFVVLSQLFLSNSPLSTDPPFLKERFACRVWTGIPPVEASIVNWQVSNMIKAQRKGTEILLLGDSSCLMGLRPKIIERETGLRCWNLGTVGTLGTEGHATLLSTWIKHCGPPRYLVYHIVPYCLSERSADDRVWTKLLKEWIASGAEEDQILRSLPSEKLRTVYHSFLNSIVDCNQANQDDLNTPRGYYPSDNVLAEILRRNNGWMPEYLPAVAPNAWQEAKFLKPFSTSCEAGLLSLFQLSQEHNIQLIVQLHDVPALFHTKTTEVTYRNYERELKRLSLNFPNVHIANPFLNYIPTKLCASAHHLTPEGAAIHSRDLALKLRRLNYCDRSIAQRTPDKTN